MIVLPSGRRPQFPDPAEQRPGPDGLVAIGGDLTPETVLEAYGKGLFPWEGRPPYPWYSPDPRMVLRPGAFHASHSLRKLDRQGRLEVRLDTAFRETMWACATTPRHGRTGSWITPRMVSVYGQLHRLGVAHSVEVYEEGALVGGLYGLSVGGLFFGESMFARRRDASKLALWCLCRRAARAGFDLVDCQVPTPHLRSLGAVPMARAEYLEVLARSWARPDLWPAAAAGPPDQGSATGR